MITQIINTFFARTPRVKPKTGLLKQVKIIAHRGAHDHRQGIFENTHAAFERARQLGCWGVELDVRSTADHVLIVHHDPHLKRLWKQSAWINQLTYQQLHAIAPEVPRLDEVIARYGHQLHLFIELKAPFHDQVVLQKVLSTLLPMKDYHLISLKVDLLARLTAFPVEALLLVPTHYNVGSFCRESLAKPYGGILGHYSLLTARKIAQLRQANQQIGVGFVESKYSLYREVNRGIHWLFTDNAAALMEIMHWQDQAKRP